jgi:23S rRNA (guanosine2251-2'-O)-methyltransferase
MRIFGKNPVIERIKARPETISKLYLQKRTDLSEVVKAAKAAGIHFESIDSKEMGAICGAVHSQGVVAEVPDFEYYPFDKLLADCVDGKTIPVLLDGVTDPQNLGSIIRTLACIGGFAIVLPEYESAEVNETVLRVASGGENYVPVSRVKKIIHAVSALKEKNVTVCGAVVDGDTDILALDLTDPVALVVGAEGKGIRPTIVAELDKKVALSMKGADLSFNVAIATAIMGYEIGKRREARP